MAVGGCLYARAAASSSGTIGGSLEAVHGSSSEAIGGVMMSVHGIASGTIGGCMYSDATTHDPFYIGGCILTQAPVVFAYIGGYLNSLPLLTRTKGLGGVVYSLADDWRSDIGGFAIGTWSVPGVTIVDGLARTLVKAVDKNTVAQAFSTDGQFVIYAEGIGLFDAKLVVGTTDFQAFDALLDIIKIRKNPHIEIIETQITGIGPWTVKIIASGHAFDINNHVIANGIQKADFVWTDGNKSHLDDVTSSGAIFSSSHVYSHSGLYHPIVMGYDKLSTVGSDTINVNLASGIAHPYIDLSGTPRAGLIPPPLTVDFAVQVSGIQGSHTVYWDYGNGVTQYNNTSTTMAQYAMQGDFIPYVALRDERNIVVVDTLRIGYNR